MADIVLAPNDPTNVVDQNVFNNAVLTTPLSGAPLLAQNNTGKVVNTSGNTTVQWLFRYMAVKYADNPDGLNFSDSFVGRLYYGLRNVDTITESESPADYSWYPVSGGGFGTTNYLFYQTGGGRHIEFFIGQSAPSAGYGIVPSGAIDLDVVTGASVAPAIPTGLINNAMTGMLEYTDPAQTQLDIQAISDTSFSVTFLNQVTNPTYTISKSANWTVPNGVTSATFYIVGGGGGGGALGQTPRAGLAGVTSQVYNASLIVGISPGASGGAAGSTQTTGIATGGLGQTLEYGRGGFGATSTVGTAGTNGSDASPVTASNVGVVAGTVFAIQVGVGGNGGDSNDYGTANGGNGGVYGRAGENGIALGSSAGGGGGSGGIVRITTNGNIQNVLQATSNGPLIIDGYITKGNDYICLNGQMPAWQNGIWLVLNPGDSSTPFALVRPAPYDVYTGLYQASFTVLRGIAYGGKTFKAQILNTGTINSDPISFVNTQGSNVLGQRTSNAYGQRFIYNYQWVPDDSVGNDGDLAFDTSPLDIAALNGVGGIALSEQFWTDVQGHLYLQPAFPATPAQTTQYALQLSITNAGARTYSWAAATGGILGGTWHDETANRSFGTEYTNNRTVPIAVTARTTCASNSAINFIVNGISILNFNWQWNGCGAFGGGFVIVPAGNTYQLNSGQSLNFWRELY